MSFPMLINTAAYENEPYYSKWSVLIDIFCFPCFCFCPEGTCLKRNQEYDY